ncbi:hypothetical protein ERO13_D01G114560v2 [Gossypium hirsutum]|uniref:Uncharacterized protein n=2 Tax=Gossypium TaxID=3633 RepID=A0A5D2M9T5_GOSTO|nr:hypothetical protein ERO13_D01G114560v2 [Gossypium hirsutum]TYG83193.1 hypothetical protein ES288_D01G149600v1 [Gossypium darwinii]TYH87889.1 hypothetical protein ES332_D01G150100v1 [Gossypium tomentosum]
MLLQSTASKSSLFDHLINIWEFNPGAVLGTFSLYFLVDFKFQSSLYQQHLKSFGHVLLTTTLVAGIDSTIQFTISKRPN